MSSEGKTGASRSEPPPGQRFSLAYAEAGKPLQDSPRARARIAAYIEDTLYPRTSNIIPIIRRELGTGYLQYASDIGKLLRDSQLRDFLDAISLIGEGLITGTYKYPSEREHWFKFVERVFREQNVGYQLDAMGGVRFFVDEEFEHNRSSVLAGLGTAKRETAREAFEDAHRALATVPVDTLSAVRRAFDATENVFKAMTGEARLGKSEIDRVLKRKLGEIYEPRALDAAKLIADGLSAWTNAAHQYRHETGQPEPEPPPIDIAVSLVSAAGGQLRWLVEIEGRLAKAAGKSA